MQPWQPQGWPGYPPGHGFPFAPPKPLYAYASFWRRFFALILDSIIVAVVGFSSVAILWSVTGIELFDLNTSDSSFSLSASNWPIALLSTAYYVIMNGRGATLGKMALGIRVTDREGGVPGLGRGALRGIIPAIGAALDLILSLAMELADRLAGIDAALTTGLAGIGIIFGYSLFQIVDGLSMLGDEHRQTIHDKMGGTYVIRG